MTAQKIEKERGGEEVPAFAGMTAGCERERLPSGNPFRMTGYSANYASFCSKNKQRKLRRFAHLTGTRAGHDVETGRAPSLRWAAAKPPPPQPLRRRLREKAVALNAGGVARE
jgi:hypothetical protein